MTTVAQSVAPTQRSCGRNDRRSNRLPGPPPDLFTDTPACAECNPKLFARPAVWCACDHMIQMSEAAILDKADFRAVAIDPQEPSLYDGTTKKFPASPARGVGKRTIAGSHHLPGRSHLKEIATCPNDGMS